MSDLGRILILAGLLLFLIGGLFSLFPRLGITIGRLPGDIRFETGQLTCLIPIGTSILLSILLTIGSNLLGRFINH